MGTCAVKEEPDKAQVDINAVEAMTKDDSPKKTEDPPQAEEEVEENPKLEGNPTLEDAPEDTPQEEAPPPVEPTGRTITVSIAACRGVRESSWLPKKGSDLYVIVRTVDKDDELYRTKSLKDVVWPAWKEEAVISWNGEPLEFELMEVIYDAYDIKGQIKDQQTVVVGRGVLKPSEFEKGFNGTVLMDSRIHMDTLLRLRIKGPDGEYPPDPPVSFTVKVERESPSSQLGLSIDSLDGVTLCVRAVESGLIATYNAQAREELRVRPRDFIMSVNGASGSSTDMIQSLTGDTIELQVVRPVEHAVGIAPRKERSGHGIEFSTNVTLEWLMVTGVKPDLNAALYNEEQPQNALRKSDRLIRAFGTRVGFGSDIFRTAKNSAGLQCELFRPFERADPMGSWISLTGSEA